jgi:hypothetical protein
VLSRQEGEVPDLLNDAGHAFALTHRAVWAGQKKFRALL